VALKRAGALLHVDGKLDEAERLYREALALDEALVARYPDNATYRYDMTFSLSDLALTARKRGDPAAATALYLRALEIRKAALDADPKNVRAMFGVANLHSYLGTCAAELKQFDEQVTHRREALRLFDAVVAVRGPQAEDRSRRTWWQIYLAGALMDLSERRPATDRPVLLDEASKLLQGAEPSVRDLAARRAADLGLSALFDAQRARLRHLR
jgi:tetratricopeptide (TPR) repeat protein